MPTINLAFDDRLFQSPGVGLQTPQRAALPSDAFGSTCAYIKFYAAELVRADGSYNFTPVLAALDNCTLAKQRMYTRLAVVDPAAAPNGFDSPVVWQGKMKMIAFTSADTSPPG